MLPNNRSTSRESEMSVESHDHIYQFQTIVANTNGGNNSESEFVIDFIQNGIRQQSLVGNSNVLTSAHKSENKSTIMLKHLGLFDETINQTNVILKPSPTQLDYMLR